MGLRRWFRRRPSSGEIREEIESHVRMRAESDGIDPAEARRRFGNVQGTREDVRRVWVAAFGDTLTQDARQTLRSWRRSPGFALAAILVLALGLGSATALFSAVDRILFRSLPYPAPDRLVSVGMPFPLPDGTLGDEVLVDRAYLEQWEPLPEPFESLATTGGNEACDITEARPERLSCAQVEFNLLRVLGVRVEVGRDFTPEDGLRGAPPMALISHGLWSRRFGADPNITGQTLQLDGENVSVAGVLPADFELPLGEADVLLPMRMRPADPEQTSLRILSAVARLKPGVSPEKAEVLLQPMSEGMASLLPGGGLTGGSITWRVRPLRDRRVGDASRVAWLLLGATAVLLLVACVNVTNLMLARVAARHREYAVRSALGAPRSRLARLALTESLLLAFAAGGLGLWMASALLRGFVRMAPAGIPGIGEASLDLRVYVVAAALALGAGIAVGLWPAVSVLRSELLQGTRATSATQPRVRFALVSAEIALTLAMLGASTLLGRSLLGQIQVPLGFETDGVMTMDVLLNVGKYPTPDQRAAFFDELLGRVRRAPGIETAALSGAPVPRGLVLALLNIQAEDRPWDPEAFGPPVRVRDATPGYFETFRIPIVRGRAFTESDRRSPERAAILSASLERQLFGGENAIGRRVRLQQDGPWYLVVGVAGDIRNRGLGEDPQPELYVVRGIGPDQFLSGRSASLAVRTKIGFADTEAFLRQTVADLDPELPVEIESLDRQVAGLTERPRFVASLTAAFTGIALLVAAAGLYGVVSYLVSERTRDIGVRLALGATPGRISGQLLGEAGRWILGGAALGLLLTWSTGRILESQLFGISPTDSLSLGLALLVLLFALLVALAVPAARAARVDPMTALREE